MAGPWCLSTASFSGFTWSRRGHRAETCWDVVGSTILKLRSVKVMEDDRGRRLWRASYQTIQVSGAKMPLLDFK